MTWVCLLRRAGSRRRARADAAAHRVARQVDARRLDNAEVQGVWSSRADNEWTMEGPLRVCLAARHGRDRGSHDRPLGRMQRRLGLGPARVPEPACPVAPPPPVNTQAYRFLNQATFGATEASAQRFGALDDRGGIRTLDRRATHRGAVAAAAVRAGRVTESIPDGFNVRELNKQRQDIWFQNVVRGNDQLRQRVAWALSQIMVVSQVTLNDYPFGLADYYDMLSRDAFGDFRKLIEDVTCIR